MTGSSPTGPALLVPITVEALPLPKPRFLEDGDWQWGVPSYGNLGSYGTVDPSPTVEQAPNPIPGTTFGGVLLHWALPDALTHGVQNVAGEVEYPPVPNRWLVVRKCRQAGGAAWDYSASVVVSDWLQSGTGALFPVPQPYAPSWGHGTLGGFVELSKWGGEGSVTTLSDPPLTAVGPGDATFAASVPLVTNVLSFTDNLLTVDPGPLSYAVYGWYSDPANDPLSDWTTTADWRVLMQRLGWSVGDHLATLEAIAAGEEWSRAHGLTPSPGQPRTRFPTRTICHGLVYAVDWLGPEKWVSGAPPKDPALPGWVRPRVAVGHTAAEALTALLAESDQTQGQQDAEHLRTILDALQTDALPLVGTPGGAGNVATRVQSSWFGAVDGGTEWQLVPPDGSGTADPSQEQADGFTGLNRSQRELDASSRRLAALQWQLHGYWTMCQQLVAAKKSTTAIDAAMAAVQTQIDAESNRFRALRQRRDTAFVTLSSALQGFTLKAKPAPPFQRPNDPVVLISGARRSYKHGEDGRFSDDGSLFCRFSGQTISALDVKTPNGDVVVAAGSVPLCAPAGPDVPPDLIDLDAEAFFLDPLNAPWIAQTADPSDPWPLLPAIRRQQTLVWNAAGNAALNQQTLAELAGLQGQGGYGNVPSKVGVEPWALPWTPLFLSWEALFRPAAGDPPATLRTDTWALAPHDSAAVSQDLAWQWSGATPPPTPDPSDGVSLPISGRALLTPNAPVTLAARVEQLVELYGDEAAAQSSLWALQDALEYVQNADLLAQSLGGFGDALLERQGQTALRAFDSSLDPYLNPPGAPALDPRTRSWPQGSDTQLNSVRAGHFALNQLWVVDAFGQKFDVLAAIGQVDALHSVVTAPDMKSPAGSAPSVVELKPRVQQPSRLDIALLDADDDSLEVGVVTGADPVCGWVIPNQLDRSLMVYDRDGAPLGELLSIQGAGGSQPGTIWLPPPESAPLPAPGDPVDPAIANRHLKAMVTGIAAGGGAEGVLEAADAAAAGKAASGVFADEQIEAMIGRPLAVVRARVRVELSRALATSQSWDAVGQGITRGYEDVRFPVQLGSTELIDDGVAGYFVNDGYGSMGTVYPTQSEWGTYVDNARPEVGFEHVEGAMLTLLVDPRLNVHAVAGIVPPATVAIPPGLATPDLSRMEVTFRVGPLVGSGPAVALPMPALKEGTWSWLQYEQEDSPAGGSPVTAASPLALLPEVPPVLRDGWLRLALEPPPTVLTYSVAPPAVACSPAPDRPVTVRVRIDAYNASPDDAQIAKVEVDLQDLADDLTAAQASLTGWDLIPGGGTGDFAFTPHGGGSATVAKGQTLTIEIAGVAVSTQPGEAAVAVTETTAKGSEQVSLTITKVATNGAIAEEAVDAG